MLVCKLGGRSAIQSLKLFCHAAVGASIYPPLTFASLVPPSRPRQGSLLAPSAADPVAAPGVLPWLPTLAASWYASARAIGPPPAQAVRIQAGPDGALMLVCAGPLGSAGVAAS